MSPGGQRWQTVGMRVASVQFSATTDVVANLEAIAPLVREAGRQGAELIVLPEASMHDFGKPDFPLGPRGTAGRRAVRSDDRRARP